jgi:hypothetical protein
MVSVSGAGSNAQRPEAMDVQVLFTKPRCPDSSQTIENNLLIFHNVVTMTRALHALIAEGHSIDEEECDDLTRILTAPLTE